MRRHLIACSCVFACSGGPRPVATPVASSPPAIASRPNDMGIPVEDGCYCLSRDKANDVGSFWFRASITPASETGTPVRVRVFRGAESSVHPPHPQPDVVALGKSPARVEFHLDDLGSARTFRIRLDATSSGASEMIDRECEEKQCR